MSKFNILVIKKDPHGFLKYVDTKSMGGPKFSVVIELDGLTEQEEAKVMLAVDHWMNAFNSPEFEKFVKNFSWTETVCTGRLWWKRCSQYVRKYFQFNNGLSNTEVFDIVFGGKEILGNGQIDNTAQVYLKVDRRNRRGVVGYTFPSTRFQWVFAWVLKSFSIKEISNNLSHEFVHKCGFDDSSYSASRNAVTYQVGEFVGRF